MLLVWHLMLPSFPLFVDRFGVATSITNQFPCLPLCLNPNACEKSSAEMPSYVLAAYIVSAPYDGPIVPQPTL